MRVWLYDTLTTDEGLLDFLGWDAATALERIMPRQSQGNIPIFETYLVYGLGNNTNEQLAEANDHVAHRQFFQVWVYDMGGDYNRIDAIIPLVKAALINKASASDSVTQVFWLETSQEFENDTYNRLFRYIRFQAIISKGAPA